MRKYLMLLALISFFLIAGCTPANLQTTLTTQVPTTAESGSLSYPAPPAAQESYPAPSNSQNLNGVPEPPGSPPEPIAGMASLNGVLYSYTVNAAIPGTSFYLTPAMGEEQNQVPAMLSGPNAENGDITAYSNEKGEIVLDNIPAGNYYIIVWAPMNWVIAETPEANGEPLLVKVKEGDQLELGVIYLSWP